MITLDVLRSTVFDANGEARITIFPDRARDVWKIWRYVVNTTSLGQTRCFVYRGSEQTGAHIDFTRTGNNDVSENVRDTEIDFGRPLIFVWTGGDVGAEASVSILGEVIKR